MATSSIVEGSDAPNDAPTQDIRTYNVPESTLKLLPSKVNKMETAFTELTAANAAKEDPRHERQNPEDIQETLSLHPTDSVDDEGDNTHSNVEVKSCQSKAEPVSNLHHSGTVPSLDLNTLFSSSSKTQPHLGVEQINMEEELLNAILDERSTQQLLGPEVSAKLSEVAKRYWGKGSRNSALIKKLQEDHRIPKNCEDIRVPLLN